MTSVFHQEPLMRKSIIAASIVTAFALPSVSIPTTSLAAEQSPHTFTGNIGLVSDYRFRAISQTFLKPAI